MKIISKTTINTPLGTMLGFADKNSLYILSFSDDHSLTHHLEKLQKNNTVSIISGLTPPLLLLQKELALYFANKLTQFTTPISPYGSNFQIDVWNALQKIPYGTTTSYNNIAKSINNKNACRAVGNANSQNPILILIPCHRIINKSGKLGGYTSGVDKKQWLLRHENTL